MAAREIPGGGACPMTRGAVRPYRAA